MEHKFENSPRKEAEDPLDQILGKNSILRDEALAIGYLNTRED